MEAGSPTPYDTMPKHYEYVLAAYLIFAVAFLTYLFLLRRRDRANRRALERLSGAEGFAPGRDSSLKAGS